MIVSKVQLRDLIANHLRQENGLNDVLEITLNAMMKNERSLHLEDANDNKANGYRPGCGVVPGPRRHYRAAAALPVSTNPNKRPILYES